MIDLVGKPGMIHHDFDDATKIRNFQKNLDSDSH